MAFLCHNGEHFEKSRNIFFKIHKRGGHNKWGMGGFFGKTGNVPPPPNKILGVKINTNKIYKKGDKIAQLIWCMHNHPFLKFTDTIPPSQRALGGFGSTGY